MSIELITIFMFASMIGLLATGRHVFAVVGAVGTISALALWGPRGGEDMAFYGGFTFLQWYPLLAIPPFIFMGLTLARSGIADNLYEAMYKWMGGIKGGLGMGTIGLCAIIAAMSGLNIAATVTASTIALPSMMKRKYDKQMLVGTILAGGALGFLIPPSIVFIIYGMIAKVSVGHLWVAGILPGILLSVMYIAYIGIRCKRQPSMGPPIPEDQRVGLADKLRSLRGAAIAPIILIFVVLGLLFMGVTTLIECAAIGTVGAITCAAITKRLTRQLIIDVMDETLVVSTMIMWIFSGAILFGAVFDGLGAIHAMEHLLLMMGGGTTWGTLIAMQLGFFLMGTVMDDTAMLLIVAPLYVPIVANLGFSLVWFGVLYVVNCQMAFITPPFGYNLFILRGLAPKEITMMDIYKSVIPFVGIQAACLGIIMAFPQIALWLPSVIFPGR